MDFTPKIGLEIHVQLNTKTKMFSSAPVSFGLEPNKCVSITDVAFPGTFPTVNKKAVGDAISLCHVLHMSIDNELHFVRKNYFYSDLPKGYQITQGDRPLGKNGYLLLGDKKIDIQRLHIEEDTCKQFHYDDYSLLDFNRAGIPLLEIVTLPQITSGEEASRFVNEIRSLVRYLGISDGKLEEGSLRCDVNVSVLQKNIDGVRVEIKNINTLNGIKSAIDYEINRQIDAYSQDKPVMQETRRWDEDSKKTILMRKKSSAIEYRYCVEPNIPPIKLDEAFVQEAINSIKESLEERRNRYLSYSLSEKETQIILGDRTSSTYFDDLIDKGTSPKIASNWVINEPSIVMKVASSDLAKVLSLIEERKLTVAKAKEIIDKSIREGISLEELLNKFNLSIITDEREIQKVVYLTLEDNPNCVIDFKNGKDHVIRFIVGQVMKKTQGQADPVLVNKLVLEELQRR